MNGPKKKIAGPEKPFVETYDLLHKQAEEYLKNEPEAWLEIELGEATRLFHELKVQHIEIELQNDELRRTQNELERLNDKLKDVYDYAPNGYVTLDDKGTITDINLTGARMLAEDRKNIINTSFHRFIDKESQDTFYFHFRQVSNLKTRLSCELKLVSKDRTIFDAELDSLSVIENESGAKQIRMAITDISQRKSVEAEKEKLSASLQHANSELEAFTYSVSHDLRSPIRIMEGFVKMAINDFKDSMDGELLRRLNIVQENAERMGLLVDDLLRLSRVGRTELSKTQLDMEKMMLRTWGEIRSLYPGRHIEFELKDMPPGFGDSSLIRQVVYNFLSNSAKFTGNKKNPRIETGGYTEDGHNVFYVKDNGAGFSMEYYDQLFGVFRRLHKESELGGTGVGLAIVQRIIHRHGGRVWAEGEVNKGATFYFTLPEKQ